MITTQRTTDAHPPASPLTAAVDSRELAASAYLSRVALWQYDIASDAVRIDPDFATSLGFKPEDLTTRADWMARIHPDDRASLDQRLKETLATTASSPERDQSVGECRMIHKDGSIRWVRARIAVRRNAAGEAVSAIGVVEDMTDRKAGKPRPDADREILRTA